MQEFDKINSTNVMSAEVGDVFKGYGRWGDEGQRDVVLVDKDCGGEIIYACFYELNKDGSLSKYWFDYTYSVVGGGRFSERHRDRHRRE